tara:strand:- start:310 stop:915 length:606 start_codon:yes stop_codon:yes gene_type:complete
MNKRIALYCIASFATGILAHRLVVISEVKKLEAKSNTAVAKLFGYDNEQARELMGTVSAKYTPEEFVELLGEVAEMGRNTTSLFHDERLYGTLRNLSYLETLRESGADTLDRTIREDIIGFYEDFEHLLTEEPSSQFEESSLAALKRIQTDLNLIEQTEGVEPSRSSQLRVAALLSVRHLIVLKINENLRNRSRRTPEGIP